MMLAAWRWILACLLPETDAGTAPAPEWPPPW
jgi:hypothetical protein